MKRNDVGLRLAALGAAVSLSVLLLGAILAAFGDGPVPRAVPDPLPVVAQGAGVVPIPVEIVPGRIEVSGARTTETAERAPMPAAPRS